MNQINHFWNYFKQNNFVFLLLNEIPKDELKIHFDKLISVLHLYNKDLNLIIKNKSDVAELIVTANGNPYLFKDVELLVHHAPVVERWRITAFLQPEQNIVKYQNGTDKPFEYNGINLKMSEIYFQPLRNIEKPTDLGIKIYLKNYIIHKDNPKLRDVVYMHIEYLIGEKSFANNITFIEIGQLTCKMNDIELLDLYNLADYINLFKEQK